MTDQEAERYQNIVKIEGKSGVLMEKPSLIDKFERMDCKEN